MNLKVTLLHNGTVWVGKVSKCLETAKHFPSKAFPKLDQFLATHPEEAQYFDQAFAYWILCELGRCKKKQTQYGFLTRKLSEYDKQLRRELLNEACSIASKIKKFQLAQRVD
ncbi:MAG: hypothetical protein Q4B28_07130 [bacterium]|nr:hypothetical protein [bacterium]